MEKKHAILFILFAIVIYITITGFLFQKLPEHDEILLLATVEGINNFGTPLTYFNEQIGLQFGYIHPPLYNYMLSWTDIFFHNILISSRLFSVLTLLLTIMFSYLIIKQLFKDYKF